MATVDQRPMIVRWQGLAVCVALAAMTLAVFGQTTGFDFVNYDDGFYVYHNAIVAGGLSWKGLGWVFTHADCNLYHPLTMLSLMADYQLHQLHAGGYHLTNILLHTSSVVLLFLVLRKMTGALWRSAFVAAVFAVHPLRVESVAWVSERKDVLGTFFFVLTLMAYERYIRKPNSLARYGLVALAFAMALLSKPTVVTLPFVLLLLDYWPLQRTESARRLVLEKIPLLVLSAGACAMTVLGAGKEIEAYAHVSLFSRIGNACVSYGIYLRQMIWPEGLAAFYPRPQNGYSAWTIGCCVLLLTAITVSAWAFRRQRRWLLTGWLWYLGMLTPMIGLVQAGAFAHADRMTYLPQIGVYIVLTWLAVEWAVKWNLGRVAIGGVALTLLAAMLVCAVKQIQYWQDSETLWTHALACTKGNYMAQYNLAGYLVEKGNLDQAIPHYQATVQIKPDHAEAWNNLGTVYFQQGQLDNAIAQYQKAVQIKPAYASAHYNLAIAYQQKGNLDGTLAEFQSSLQINSSNADAEYNIASILDQQGKAADAKSHYQKVLQIRPDYAEGLFNLGNDYRQAGKIGEAITQYQGALQIKPDYTAAHVNLGSALLQSGKFDEAIAHFQKALQIDPGSAQAHNNLGNAFLQRGNPAEAIVHFEKAVQFAPDDPWAKNNLAWLLATSADASLRNGHKAVELARAAAELAPEESPLLLHTLAAALAEARQYSEAVETAQSALLLAEAQSRPRLIDQLQSEIKLYQAGLAFHVSAQLH